MRDFRRETLDAMHENNLLPDDVVFIGSYDYEYGCTWAEFEKLADFLYDASYGTAYLPSDLVIRFKDTSYLERREYDGSEWWEYVEFKPNPGTEPKKIYQFISNKLYFGGTVAALNPQTEIES